MSDASSATQLDGPPISGGFALSLGCGFGALAVSAALVASARSFGDALELALVFAVLTVLEVVAYAHAVRPWLYTGRAPRRGQLIQALVALLVLLAFAARPALGLVGLCALAAGAFLPNASTIRTRRVDQSFTGPGEDRFADERGTLAPSTLGDALGDAVGDRVSTRARPAPKVGQVLRATVAASVDRWLAWAAATLAATVSGLALRTPGEGLLLVDLVGVTALAWATLRLLASRTAQREFEEAAGEPYLAYVVLVRDAKAPGRRPLLGVWAKEPLAIEDRLPRARAVYRCERECTALIAGKGALVVHRAWVDSGPKQGARPRWVAGDAGIALPRRRSLLGSWYLASLIGSERSPRARPLTRPAPDPTAEAETGTIVTVISEPTRETGRFVRLFVQRLIVLALLGLFLAWARLAG